MPNYVLLDQFRLRSARLCQIRKDEGMLGMLRPV
jgi:hypothetical protein